MGLSGLFKENSYKQEIEDLHKQIEELNAYIDKAGRNILDNIVDSKDVIADLEKRKTDLSSSIENLEKISNNLDTSITEKRKQISSIDDEILVESFGLYKPVFSFASSTQYQEALAYIRHEQKDLIKNNKAVTGSKNWTVNGSAAKGQKMVKDMQKLLLRAFNSDCDSIVEKVKYTNFDASLKKLYASAEAITKLGASSTGVAITKEYIISKVKELHLAFEYQQKKQEEKEHIREERARAREEAKLQKELAEQKIAISKEQKHYEHALSDILNQIANNPDNQDLLQKKADIETQLAAIENSLKDIDYREANQKAGYVYIISNIGAFGENIYKIGMTRRLDPQERIDELGDASVPFNFDVHAMIFSDNAPALEAALHRAFEDKKVNMVNTRREFFNVTLDEIKKVVTENFDKTVDFHDVPDAEQFRMSQRMREKA